ncbi:porin [Ideonella azotifigens]|nr:porin [Ideonella azotifigens]MCD2341892.1 porin [Ideonella azotifigens]
MNQCLLHSSLTACLTLAAGTTCAQSNVTLYGVMDAGLYQKQLAGGSRDRQVESNLMETSQLGFRGTEDLGGGWRGLFDLSTFFRPDLGAATRGIPGETFWSKSALVGVAGDWGTLRLGRMSTPGFLNMIRFNPFGASSSLSPTFLQTYVGSPTQPMTTGSGATDSGWNGSVAYTSPRLAGLVAALQVTDNKSNGGRRIGGSLSYSAGDLAATLSVEHVQDAALTFPLWDTALAGAVPPYTAHDLKTWNLGASYDFGVVKLFGQAIDTRMAGLRAGRSQDIELKTYQLGLSAPMGSGRWLLSSARTGMQRAGAQDLHRTTTSLGYGHDLSKRTDLYAVVMDDRMTELSSGTGFALGIRHRF